MTIWGDDVEDPRPGGSRAVTATAMVFAAVAWALALAVRAKTFAGTLSVGVLILGGWLVGLLFVTAGFIISLIALTRVMRDRVREQSTTSAHFWVALSVVVSWPLWMALAVDTVLDW